MLRVQNETCLLLVTQKIIHDITIIHIIFFSDVDECLKPKACGSNAFCTNSYGNYTCTCQEGFQGNPYDGVSTIEQHFDETTIKLISIIAFAFH